MASVHYELCRRSVDRRATELWKAVADKKLNESAVEGLLRSYVDQPAFYQMDREQLVDLGMSLKGFHVTDKK